MVLTISRLRHERIQNFFKGTVTSTAGVAAPWLLHAPSPVGQADHTMEAAARNFLKSMKQVRISPCCLTTPPIPSSPISLCPTCCCHCPQLPYGVRGLPELLLPSFSWDCGESGSAGDSGSGKQVPPLPVSAPGLAGNTLEDRSGRRNPPAAATAISSRAQFPT